MEFLDFKDLYNNLSNRYLEISKYLNLEEVKEQLLDEINDRRLTHRKKTEAATE